MRAGRDTALPFLNALDRGSATVVWLTMEEEKAAIRLIKTHDDKKFSFCDAASFVLMERLGIQHAMAFDRHFIEYGKVSVLST